MKDTKSILLVLLSVGLVSTWIYHLYDKTIYSKQNTENLVKDSGILFNSKLDSLKENYSSAANEADIKFISSLAKTDTLFKNDSLSAKIAGINQLKNDIGTILNNDNANSSDLENAQQKITILQTMTASLRNDKTVMEEKKKRMTAIMEQVNNETNEVEKDVKKLEQENKALNQKINTASTFKASKLRLTPMSTVGTSEKETSKAYNTNKFDLSFVVQNNLIQFNNTEVYVVIIKPGGAVLKSQQIWESGTFDISNGSKKNYSLKMRFEYNKGEPKQLHLTLNAENYPKGDYKMQIYHNGIMIGQTIKKLS